MVTLVERSFKLHDRTNYILFLGMRDALPRSSVQKSPILDTLGENHEKSIFGENVLFKETKK